MRTDGIDGVVVTQDGLFFATRQSIANLALSHRLPLIVYSRETVEAGALASYGPSNYGIFRRSAFYIDRILKGSKPADLPVEQPTKLVHYQSQDCQGARQCRAGHPACPRRRSDLIATYFCSGARVRSWQALLGPREVSDLSRQSGADVGQVAIANAGRRDPPHSAGAHARTRGARN